MSVPAHLLALAAMAAAAPQTQPVQFITCPVYRDTDAGKKSGCWLADDPASGKRYDVSMAPTKPDWNFAILVEGVSAPDGGNPCGGTVLNPVRVSVLDRPCTRFMLEAETYTGRPFTLPVHNVRPLYEEREKPAPPFSARRFSIPFDFGSSFISYQNGDYYLDAMINYALDVQPARIRISGRAQTTAMPVSGQVLAEPADLARERADKIRRALMMRGVDPAKISIETDEADAADTEPFQGLQGPLSRRVDVTVTCPPGAMDGRPGHDMHTWFQGR